MKQRAVKKQVCTEQRAVKKKNCAKHFTLHCSGVRLERGKAPAAGRGLAANLQLLTLGRSPSPPVAQGARTAAEMVRNDREHPAGVRRFGVVFWREARASKNHDKPTARAPAGALI